MEINEIKIGILKIPAIFLAGYLVSTQLVFASEFKEYQVKQALTNAEDKIERLTNKKLELNLNKGPNVDRVVQEALLQRIDDQLDVQRDVIKKYKEYQ